MFQKKKYGLVPYNDCLGGWKETCKEGKCTDPDNERERVPKSNIEKLKEYTYYVLAGTETDPFGTGTGIAIDEHYIVTNCHVIHREDEDRFTNTIWVMNLLDNEKHDELYKTAKKPIRMRPKKNSIIFIFLNKSFLKLNKIINNFP